MKTSIFAGFILLGIGFGVSLVMIPINIFYDISHPFNSIAMFLATLIMVSGLVIIDISKNHKQRVNNPK